jgi:hypothetical protein
MELRLIIEKAKESFEKAESLFRRHPEDHSALHLAWVLYQELEADEFDSVMLELLALTGLRGGFNAFPIKVGEFLSDARDAGLDEEELSAYYDRVHEVFYKDFFDTDELPPAMWGTIQDSKELFFDLT